MRTRTWSINFPRFKMVFISKTRIESASKTVNWSSPGNLCIILSRSKSIIFLVNIFSYLFNLLWFESFLKSNFTTSCSVSGHVVLSGGWPLWINFLNIFSYACSESIEKKVMMNNFLSLKLLTSMLDYYCR